MWSTELALTAAAVQVAVLVYELDWLMDSLVVKRVCVGGDAWVFQDQLLNAVAISPGKQPIH